MTMKYAMLARTALARTVWGTRMAAKWDIFAWKLSSVKIAVGQNVIVAAQKRQNDAMVRTITAMA